ncbi:Outer membrane protein assembly factor BamB, contains PQQ-like beta-propeller repeat [Halogranum gelatinilyticum]|uniref:Outer membrane protein assembly factor BamB, contains PQQ-like beta-propeller repeat n=1 Tax=Halogranum gelatinilyticum TaxID=660521 RepID=A0A1G9VLI6_9EURY|nr:PQQ-binding-like beta-propeller repeat protein [Halogranum gelatinilyticum]SDM72970.1 Outer membrane protein assembly factor BamB, contains PQQ-like beta-propeller repeat [Halogranum gelatinilyticum]
MRRRSALHLAGGSLSVALAGCVAIPSLTTDSSPPTPTERWRFALDDPLAGRPAVAPQNLLVPAADELLALSQETGQQYWQTSATEPSVDVADEMFFLWTPDADPELRVFDLDSYAPAWEATDLRTMPTAVDGTAYLSVGDTSDAGSGEYTDTGGLRAVDIRSGETRWSVATPGPEPLADADADTAYVWFAEDSAEQSRGVSAVSVADGSERWHTAIETSWGPTMRAGDTLVVGSDSVADGSARVAGLDATDGSERWTFDPDGSATSAFPRLASDDHVVVWSWSEEREGTTTALDPQTGERRWNRDGDSTPQVLADGLVCLVSTEGVVSVLDAADGSERWTHDTAPGLDVNSLTPSVRLYDGALYVVTADAAWALDAASGAVRWRFEPTGEEELTRGWEVGDGGVYLSTRQTLYAFESEDS